MQFRLNRLFPAKMFVHVCWDCQHFKNSLQLFWPNIIWRIQFIFTRRLITPFHCRFIILHYSLFLLYPLVRIFFRFHTYSLGLVCQVSWYVNCCLIRRSWDTLLLQSSTAISEDGELGKLALICLRHTETPRIFGKEGNNHHMLMKTHNSNKDAFPCSQKARSRWGTRRTNTALKGEHQKLENALAICQG